MLIEALEMVVMDIVMVTVLKPGNSGTSPRGAQGVYLDPFNIFLPLDMSIGACIELFIAAFYILPHM